MNNERYLSRLVDPIVDETLAICGAVYHDGAHVGFRPEFGAVKMQFANRQNTIWKNSRLQTICTDDTIIVNKYMSVSVFRLL